MKPAFRGWLFLLIITCIIGKIPTKLTLYCTFSGTQLKNLKKILRLQVPSNKEI